MATETELKILEWRFLQSNTSKKNIRMFISEKTFGMKIAQKEGRYK